jgi:hypothetical protein
MRYAKKKERIKEMKNGSSSQVCSQQVNLTKGHHGQNRPHGCKVWVQREKDRKEK